jgi:pimeloyl-ACP methyl ester carboxylesterase
VPGLAERFRVTAYDLRGHGASDMPLRGYGAAEMAADLDALLDHLGIGCADLVGHSYGGEVVLQYAVHRSNRVRTLTLADPVVGAFSSARARVPGWRRGYLRRRLEEAGIAVRPEAFMDGPHLLEQMATLATRRPRLSPEGEAAFVPFGSWNGSTRAARRWHELLRDTTLLADCAPGRGPSAEAIRQIRCPCLVVVGRFSRYRAMSRRLRRHLCDCRAVIVPGVGHFHPIVRPDWFARTLDAFLSEGR